MVLKCANTAFTVGAVVNPIFGIAGSLTRLVLHHVDDEDIKTLKREFGRVNRALDEISQQNQNALLQIKKETLDGQYCQVEENLRNQFRKFMEIMEAQPEHQDGKKDDFKESYGTDLGDQNLHTLYGGVMGECKLFSEPILEVYMKHSQGDLQVMEHLCTRLTYLFYIGLIALMGHAAIIGDDEESLCKDWVGNMENVQKKMQERTNSHPLSGSPCFSKEFSTTVGKIQREKGKLVELTAAVWQGTRDGQEEPLSAGIVKGSQRPS
ncbi:hypothetical protein AAFF_G00426550 [Aldrovandia affinis]|uniref:Uncharacterized protein n=1 Tax=Aldrovandia affinis TaxID=143900 RepID=A0AAD7WIZ1_9TELE|nr:hypothetical protein AAFF_G00426550 [Aldrovandia affinis]